MKTDLSVIPYYGPESRLLIYTVGLPASGKTTLIRAWVAQHPTFRVRISRDDYRDMMFGAEAARYGRDGKPDPAGDRSGEEVEELAARERAVTAAQHAAIAPLLAAGYQVAVDDTNLEGHVRNDLRQIGWAAGATVAPVSLTGVPAQTCIDRDRARRARGDRYVGEEVILRMQPLAVAYHDAAEPPSF